MPLYQKGFAGLAVNSSIGTGRPDTKWVMIERVYFCFPPSSLASFISTGILTRFLTVRVKRLVTQSRPFMLRLLVMYNSMHIATRTASPVLYAFCVCHPHPELQHGIQLAAMVEFGRHCHVQQPGLAKKWCLNM
eukprot:6483934-Amphidinium_carterae.1